MTEKVTKQNVVVEQSKPNRIAALDRLKGVCVFLMLFFTAAGFFPSLGFLYQIAAQTKADRLQVMPDVAFSDYGTPFFLFLIGMSYAISFAKRAKENKPAAYLHFAKRYLWFIGLGSILASIDYYFSRGKIDPILLQTILFGLFIVASLTWVVLCFFKDKSKKARFVIGKIISYSLLILGILGIVFGAIDLVHQFISSSEVALSRSTYYMHWSILHTIGFSGLLGLAFAGLSLNKKMIFGGIYMLAYTLFQMLPIVEERRAVLMIGGMLGCFGWVIVVFSGMIFMELFLLKKRFHWPYLIALGVYLALSIPSVIFLSSTSTGVSINFLLTGIVAFSSIFYLLSLFDAFECKFAPFTWWGRNPLLIFGVGCLFKVVLIYWDPKEVPIWGALLFLSFSLAFMIGLSYYLNKKNLVLRL